MVSPCGSGKTVIFSFLTSQISHRGKCVWIAAHREELIEQISQTLDQFRVQHSFIAAGRPTGRHPVCVASVFSAARRLGKLPAPDVIIIDEAHHAIKGSTWGKLLAEYPNALKIGVTATPERLSGEPLSDIFDDMILGPSVSELIKMGSLSKYKAFAPPGIDVSQLATRAGDFARGQLAAAADKPTITGDAIREYTRLAAGKQAVAFCVSIEHAKHVAEQFTASGYPALCIDGTMSRELRRDVVRDFREGRIRVMTSCDIISEGFDLPAIEVAIMLRPTKSLALWIQQSGRALRPFPGKEFALLLDHAGNIERHGLPDEDRVWSLEGRLKSKKASKGPTVKVCPKCFAAQFSGRASCSFCGHVFDVVSREVQHVEGDLVEVDPQVLRQQRLREQAEAETLEDLIKIGRARRYKSPIRWAQHVLQAREAKKFAQGRR